MQRSLQITILCVLNVAVGWGCGPSQGRSDSETDPFVAGQRQLDAVQWSELIKQGERLLVSSTATPIELQRMSDHLLNARNHALTRSTARPISMRAIRRSAALVAQLEHRRRMSEAPVRVSLAPVTVARQSPPVFTWPISSPHVTSEFGARIDPFEPSIRSFHNGIDIWAQVGAGVYAAAEGQIVEAGPRNDGCGLGVTIAHGSGFASDYCHLSGVRVIVGQMVSARDLIGHVGNTGRSTGPHLHWSVWRSGRAINPRFVVRKVVSSVR